MDEFAPGLTCGGDVLPNDLIVTMRQGGLAANQSWVGFQDSLYDWMVVNRKQKLDFVSFGVLLGLFTR
jgi:hypothetical protein